MKMLTTFGVAAALMAFAATAGAEELKSGLQAGDFIGAFDVVKCAGAPEDGVKVGAQLCYRCKYGGRPQVMVFTRETTKEVASLVSELNAAVSKNADSNLRSFVNVLGDDRDAAEEAAEKLGDASKMVPVVVPVEYENGPGDYGINPKASITIIMAKGGKVQTNYALGEGKLDKATIKSIVGDVNALVGG